MIWRLLSALDRRHMRRNGLNPNTLAVDGTYRCFHRSHRLRLHCLRQWVWDWYCAKHNETCGTSCQS